MAGASHPNVDYDAVIVGAGPAGLSTALHLSQLDPSFARRCLVLEAKRHPREKACAGGITEGAVHYLRQLGVSPNDLPRVAVTRVRVRFGGRETVLHGQPCCFKVVRRSVLDGVLAGLVEERGFSLQQDTRVRSVEMAGDHVELSTERGSLRCRVVVGADGASSTVRKWLWPAGPAEHVFGLMLVGGETGVAASEAVFDFTPTTEGIVGYTWDFPAPGSGRCVGILSHGDGRAAAEYLRKHLRRHDDLAGGALPLQAAKIRAFKPSDPVSLPHALLVGDAVGIDPLLGEGIGLALGHGEVAGRALARAFAADDLGFTGYKRELLAHPVGRCLAKRRRCYRVLATRRSRLFLEPLWPFAVGVGVASVFAPA